MLRLVYFVGVHPVEKVIARVEFADMVEAEIVIVAGAIPARTLPAPDQRPKLAGSVAARRRARSPTAANAPAKAIMFIVVGHQRALQKSISRPYRRYDW